MSDNDGRIYEWLGIKATYPKIVNDAIDKANGEDLEVIINSGGEACLQHLRFIQP